MLGIGIFDEMKKILKRIYFVMKYNGKFVFVDNLRMWICVVDFYLYVFLE